ncbi:MAG: basic amino acid ABC transporter substrate-binding protein [Bacillota bacterium]|jgi:ABC-type amino acid transport substrate-binding protein|nr:basic amino acid ABC transporter substrate-binding protein [Bacillota bacterium]NLJ03659.1 basic amino acid ABC transporter substrate-binding protein [Bacillota bacterium]
MKKLAVIILAVALSLNFSTLAFGQGVLKVATEAGFMPFEYVGAETGELLGFDMDLIRAVGEVLGLEVKIDNISWDGLIPALLNNNYDAVIAGVTITPERQENVAFSKPYFESVLTIVTRQGASEAASLDDLAGKVVAVQISTTGDFTASDLYDEGKLKSVSRFDTVADAMQAVIIGVADAVVVDLPVAQAYLEANPLAPLAAAGPVSADEHYGIAVNKNNVELLEKINAALDELEQNGTYAEIYAKWFGANTPAAN